MKDGGHKMRERTMWILLTLSTLIVLQTGVAGKAQCDDGKEETRFKNEGRNPGIEEALPPDQMAETKHVLGSGASTRYGSRPRRYATVARKVRHPHSDDVVICA